MDKNRVDAILALAAGLTKLGVRTFRDGDLHLELSPGYSDQKTIVIEHQDDEDDGEEVLFWSSGSTGAGAES